METWIRRLTSGIRLGPGDLASLLCPARCRGCGGVADEGVWRPDLCPSCAGELVGLPILDGPVPTPRGLDGVHACFRFEGPIRRLLHEVKYGGAVRAGVRTGRRMAELPGVELLLRWSDHVVPVPLHWRRRWRRGHNQAEGLVRGMTVPRFPRGVADVLSRLLLPGGGAASPARPSALRALARRRATRPQVGLSAAQRAHNVAGAFRVGERARERLRDRNVLLVDDVVTTGATAVAAATALRRAGARRVRLLAAAWAPRIDR